MLFIFQTKKAKKILLRIVPKLSTSPEFNSKYLIRTVRKMNFSIPNNGSVSEIAKFDGFRVFIWVFKNWIPCSDATKDDLNLKELRKRIEGQPKSVGKISYPYFTLQQDKELDEDDCYPTKLEKAELML